VIAAAPSRWSDDRVDRLLAAVLRWGVLLSSLLVLAGGTVYLVRHGAEPPVYSPFRGEPGDLRSVSGILADAASGRGRGLIQLGVLLLMATPVMRVLMSVVVFVLQRDRLYVAMTLLVLLILLYSLFGSGPA
jgi:uncharacterized membrane protein